MADFLTGHAYAFCYTHNIHQAYIQTVATGQRLIIL